MSIGRWSIVFAGILALAILVLHDTKSSSTQAASADVSEAKPFLREPATSSPRSPPRLVPDVQYRIEETQASVLLPILHSSEEGQQKAEDLIATLQRSGHPQPELASSGESMARALQNEGLVEEWSCFAAGCYFRLPSSALTPGIEQRLLAARDATAGSHILVVTADAPPNKLAMLIAEPTKGASR